MLHAQSTIFLSPNGDDIAGNGTRSSPYRTLQKGVDEAGAGGEVRLLPGAYPGPVTILQTLRIRADVPSTATIGPRAGTGTVVSVRGADSVEVTGVAFAGAPGQIAVRVSDGADDARLIDCTLADYGETAVQWTGPSSNHLVQRCTFTRVRGDAATAVAAISASSVDDVRIEDSTFVSGDRGVLLSGAARAQIVDCTFRDLIRSAVVAIASSSPTLARCRFTRCAMLPTASFWVDPADVRAAVAIAAGSDGTVIDACQLEDCGGFVGDDVVAGRYDGLFAVGVIDSTGLLVTDTTLQGNRYGAVLLEGASTGAALSRCNLVGNGTANGAGEDIALWNGGNPVDARDCFWGLPQGPQSDGAGFGNGVGGGGATAILPVAAMPYTADAHTFDPPSSLATGTEPRAIAVADFDGDGHDDLAVAEAGDGAVSLLVSQSGGFAARATTFVGGRPVALVAGRFDADAFVDLAVADEVGDRLVVLFGDGAGGFPRAAHVALARRPVRLRAAPLAGGARDDLVVACQGDPFRMGGVQVLWNDGSGAFTVSTLPGTSKPADVEVLDLNGDGRDDVVAFDLDAAASGLELYPNLGGSFGGATTVPVAGPVSAAALVRCNVDGGAPDLVASVFRLPPLPGATDVLLFRGTGTGSLLPPLVQRTTRGPTALACGDFGGEHLLLVDASEDTVLALGPMQGPSVPFYPYAQQVPSAGLPSAAATADVDGDGHDDLVVADVATRTLQLHRARQPAAVATYGNGCAGSNGVPRITIASTPVLGASTFAVSFDRGRPSTAAALLMGVTRADVPLFNGCHLLVQPLATFGAATDAAGRGSLSIPVPVRLQLVGGVVHNQWLILDPPSSFAATQGLTFTVGG